MVNSSPIASRVQLLWNRWFYLSPELTPTERRYYTFAAVGFPPTWLVHFLYFFLFAYWDVWPLAIVNIFSVIAWSIIIVLWRQQRLSLALTIAVIEIIFHTTLVIIFLGWGFGVQYFVFVLFVGIALLSLWPRWIVASMTALCALLFILWYYYTEFSPPLASAPPLQLAIINVINIFVAFGLLGAATIYLISVAEQAEEASEALLNNVLPKPIAARLKKDNVTIADSFQNASILFADIVGFTPLSQQLSPKQLVELLDTIFSRFDDLVDEYGLEKIKTVGDEYMVASGIPIPREDHAEALALFALAIRDSMNDYNQVAKIDLQLRIGLNSGPVVAGIIGKRRFLYDLWGDSVNIASRMESHGQPGEIHVTEATQQLLSDRFTVIGRGAIDIKGKGQMQTYFLQGAVH